MRHDVRLRRPKPEPRILTPLAHGPFGPVTIHTETAAENVEHRRGRPAV